MTIHINLRKVALIALAVATVFGLLWAVDALATGPAPAALGGTGTTAIPLPGQVLVGTGSGAYMPTYILCAGTCTVATSSGGITITGTGIANNTGNWAGTWQLFNPSDFLASSTQKVVSVNGLSGVVTITSSTLGVVWPTVNGNKSAAYTITATTGVTSTVSGATTTISVSLNNGSTVTCSANQFLNTISATGTAACGSITFPTAMTYTFVAGGGLSVSQATSSSNTTTTITLNLGMGCSGSNYVQTISSTGTITCSIPASTATTTVTGTNGVTVAQVGTTATASLDTTYAALWTALETFSKGLTANGTTTLASTTNSLLLTNSSGVVFGFAGSNPCSAGQFAVSISATGTIGCAAGVTTVNGSSGAITITSSSLGVIYNPNWLTTAITSINGNTTAAQTFTGGTGISVLSAGGNTTSTNVGVTSFIGQGCVTASNSTGTVSLSVTCITTSTFNATGTAFTFSYWNATGDKLSASSSVSYVSSTNSLAIGTDGQGLLLGTATNNNSTIGFESSAGTARATVGYNTGVVGADSGYANLTGASGKGVGLTVNGNTTTTVYVNTKGDTSFGTTTDCGLICIVNASNTVVMSSVTSTNPNNLWEVDNSASIAVFSVSSSSVTTVNGPLTVQATTTIPTVTASSPLATDANNNIIAKPALASSSLTFNIYDATTTAPYRFAQSCFNKTITIAKITVSEFAAAATDTIQWIRTTALATSTLDTQIATSTAATSISTSTTSFSSSTITAGTCLTAVVSSTVGTPSWTVAEVDYTTF